jgi:endonuclease/exonuclease/phosphatase family metal-dependent hydrolase
VPAKSDGSLLLATWNIREFGGSKYGGRTTDAMYYIAECMNRFDLIAVQEVRADLKALKDILRLLGRQWDVIFTDVSYADGGNFERLAFVYNTAKVSFTGLAGELVLPSKSATEQMSQIARTPFVCGFQVGWAKFNLCTVHIYYGTSTAENPRRVDEIGTLAKLLAGKAKDYINTEAPVDYSPEHHVLLGDFNIFSRTDETYEALTRNKFEVPSELQKLPMGSNVSQDKFYDQIAFFKQKVGVKNTKAGIFNFYDYVFDDPRQFKGGKGAPTATTFKDWRTYQMSDHLIMWSEFSVDQTDIYLKTLAVWDGK